MSNSALQRGYQCPPDVFAEICADLLHSGTSIRFIAQGDSMLPNLHGGDTLICAPVETRRLKVGDIIFFRTADGQGIFHRIIRMRKQNELLSFQVQADNALKPDGWKSSAEILGRITRIIRASGTEVDLRTLKMSLINGWAAFRSRSKLNRFQHVRTLEQGFVRALCE